MNNIKSSTDTKNNSKYHDLLAYPKPKPRTVMFAINTIQGVTGHDPNLGIGVDNINNKNLSMNTKNQSSIFHDSGNNATPTQRRQPKIEIIWKPGILNCGVSVTRYANDSFCNNVLLDRTNLINDLPIKPEILRGNLP